MNYKEKKEELMKKYENAIRAIAIANDVDMGVAYEMFKTNIMSDGKYQYVKFSAEEAKKDFEELSAIAGESVK